MNFTTKPANLKKLSYHLQYTNPLLFNFNFYSPSFNFSELNTTLSDTPFSRVRLNQLTPTTPFIPVILTQFLLTIPPSRLYSLNSPQQSSPSSSYTLRTTPNNPYPVILTQLPPTTPPPTSPVRLFQHPQQPPPSYTHSITPTTSSQLDTLNSPQQPSLLPVIFIQIPPTAFPLIILTQLSSKTSPSSSYTHSLPPNLTFFQLY